MRDLSSWIDFFAAAGVPPMVRKTYAQIFLDHRITNTVVADLEKEHLRDMGISVVGDMIVILKQCKKVGHEVVPLFTPTHHQSCLQDPSTAAIAVPSVSSTTPSSEPVQRTACLSTPSQKPVHAAASTTRARALNYISHPSTEVVRRSELPRRRMTPEVEGKYIVKMPSGTTAKTKRILAAIKQREAVAATRNVHTVNSAVNMTSNRKPVARIPNSMSGFGENDDADESDGYRVILSKQTSEHPCNSTTPRSVFNRLGAATETAKVSSTTTITSPSSSSSLGSSHVATVAQRLIRRSITYGIRDNQHQQSPQRQPGHGTRIGFATAAPHRTVQPLLSASKFSNSASSLLDKPGVKRQITSVFERLSESGTGGSPVTEGLGYAGVLKRPRLQPAPQSKPKEPKALSYSAGVLSSSTADSDSSGRSSVKNRLGSEQHSRARLQALPSAPVGTLLDNDTLRIGLSLRLGIRLCNQHRSRCRAIIDAFGLHPLSCWMSAGRFPRHAALNDIIKKVLDSVGFPFHLEPSGLDRGDGKRPDGITLFPFSHDKCLIWDTTCTDTFSATNLAMSAISPGYAAKQAEERKDAKYASLVDRFKFIPFAVETSGVLGPQALSFASSRTDNPRESAYLSQRISLDIVRGNAHAILSAGHATAC